MQLLGQATGSMHAWDIILGEILRLTFMYVIIESRAGSLHASDTNQGNNYINLSFKTYLAKYLFNCVVLSHS